MNNFVFTTSNKKIDLSLLLNSKTLSTRGLTNYLTTLETITGIQNRKIPKLKKIVKSNPAYHPNGFTQQPVGVEINWTHSELQTIAA